MKTLVAGLGNPILRDDGVGWKVAQKVADHLADTDPSIHVESFALAGISLMEQFIGYERVILIDSLNTGNYAQGQVVSFSLDSLSDLTCGHSASAHDLSLKKALELGRSMKADLPEDKNVLVVAIEARHIFEFGEDLSPEIEASVPKAVEEVLALLYVQPVSPTTI